MENIEFRGVKSVMLASCLYKQLLLLYEYKYMTNILYVKYKDYKSFDSFILNKIKEEETINDIINLVDFTDKEIELVCSFAKDTNNINYDKNSISQLPVIKIKEIMKNVLLKFVNQDIYFINSNASIDLQENLKECIKNGNPNVEFKDLVNL